METPTFRQRLAMRLEGYPLLRTLVLDGLFFVAFSAIVCCGLALAVSIPRMWQTTPDGFSKAKIRVSLIDLIQARSLSGAARSHAAAGRTDAALTAWRAALANNLGSPALHRGLLEFLRDSPDAPADQTVAGILSGTWLLALAGTNANDLVLAVDVLEKHRLPQLALDWMDRAGATGAVIEAARARCLLAAGQGAPFAAAWNRHRAEWSGDPRMRPYHDAWLAGWETGTSSVEAFLRLRESSRAAGPAGLASARLLLRAAARRGVLADLELALTRLSEGRADSVGEHVILWRHLASLGRVDEARARAKNLPFAPRLAQEAADYAAALSSLGLRDEALTYLEGAIPRFQAHPGAWEVYLAILADSRRWNDVRAAAAQVRGQTATFETARIQGIFAEYRAEVAEQRRVAAEALARQLSESRVLDNLLALRIASEFVRDGRARHAVTLLQAKRADMLSLPRYWFALFSAAMSARNSEVLSESSRELLDRAPRDPVARSNRAAVLMSVESKPLDALALTLQLVNEFPDSVPFRINHALALVLNRRVDEAAELLRRVDPSRLETQAASAYHLVLAEIHRSREDFAAARAALDRVQPGLLLPTEEDRVLALQQELRATPADRRRP